MSNVKKSNTQAMEEVHKKINSHNEVHTYRLGPVNSNTVNSKFH